MIKKKIIIHSNFNTPNYMNSPFYEESAKKINFKSWIDSRMDIFFNYTLKCFVSQTNQDFTAVYNYTESSETLVLNAIKERGGLPDNVLFVPRNEYEDVVDNLSKGYDHLYLTKLDSDDMYKKTFVDDLHKLEPKSDTEVLICNYGYMYDTQSKGMTEIWHMSPAFQTYIYKLNEEAVKYYTLDLTPLEFLDESHYSALKHKYEYMEDNNYMWIIHSENSSTRFKTNYNTDFLKTVRVIDDRYEMERIFNKFN